MNKVKSVALCLSLLFLTAAGTVQPVINPAYAGWAKCRPGTRITFTSHDNSGDVMLTQTLLRTTPDHCTVKIQTDGQTSSTSNVDIDRQFTDPGQIRAFEQQTAHSADETITTPAGTFACKRYEYPVDDTGTIRLWVCEDVPGSVVRKSETIKSPHAVHVTELTDIQ